MRSVTIAIEDQLSEVLLSRVIAEFSPQLVVGLSIGRKGNGHLRNRLPNLVSAAQAGMPVIMLTDSDGPEAPDVVRSQWMKGLTYESSRFHLAVAVQEVEAWLLADELAVAHMLGKKCRAIPVPTDTIESPKEWLLTQALKSARRIKEQLVREEHGRLKIGEGYNALAARAVSEVWSPARARANSFSLDQFMREMLTW
ncbi:hypothetical protein GCM10011512_17840 [Tersicoccus solisilvae]|uniref:DUF4276 family protein n=1 Tax=Tersicoccus solisilvae TaxID=1882339 RepID=A0ABQ1P542_9MICC|nr:DUF4276 family protein [Tersicoccus solisilvae]GGC91228.1 hypothetical protein GCM10011512_17840 [Tersicoccus solisilvae]